MERTLVLDLDGTLIDTVPDLAAALNFVLAERELPGFTHQETARMVGDGTRRLVERAFAGRDALADEAAVAAFVTAYGARVAASSRPYPGVEATLRRLAEDGWRLAVCTNKPERLARALLDSFGLAAGFAAIGGGDSFPMRKPDPAHLLATVRAAGGAAASAVMAGDHANDILAASGAGIPCIFAAWGYGTTDAGRGAAAFAAQFDELPAIASGLLGRRRQPSTN